MAFGPFRLDPRTDSLRRDGVEMRLRPRTLAVLRYLVERPARLVTKDELLSAVWPEADVGEAALTVCVNEIRKALGDDARAPRFVETVHRRGYRFLGSIQSDSRDAPSSPALVGRQRELAILQTWLEPVLRGERRVGFVTGQAGVGKTTLLETLVGSVAASAFVVGRGQCVDHYGAGEAYLPVLEALGRLARGAGGERVVATLGRYAPTWLIQMPGLLTPEQLAGVQARSFGATRERMLREMAEALEALAAEQPLILLIEDLHWSDHSTLDLIAAIARRHETARLLLLGTYRPLDAIVRGHPLRAVANELALHRRCEVLPLAPLTEADVRRYVAARMGDDAGESLAGPVYRRTEGVPLFMVAVVDALIQQGLLTGEADVETAVPVSLRTMLEQQLDRLTLDERRLLEAASVAGGTFSAATLGAALDEAVESIEERCDALVRREQFIRPAGVTDWSDGTVAACYAFRHVLYEQVLYERLPAARRARLHLKIADREEAGHGARASERAAVLAVHFERGRAAGRSVGYRRVAAEHALKQCAYPEALEHLTRGRALLLALPEDDARHDLELELLMTLGPTLIGLRGAAAAEVEAVYLRARELAERLGDGTRLFRALWGLWNVDFGRGHYRPAREMGERLLAIADPDQPGQKLEAHHALWATQAAMGETTAILPHLEAGLALYDRVQHAPLALLYGGHDAGVCGWEHLARMQWFIGYPDRALESMQRAVSLAETLGHPLTTVMALSTDAKLHYYRGELAHARESAERVASLNAIDWVDIAVVLASIDAREGRRGRPLQELYERLTAAATPRSARRNLVSLCLLAEAACELGELDVGLTALDAIPEDHRETFMAPEVLRVRGELLRRRGLVDEPERCFRRAVALARTRGEHSFELRAATSLARLLAGRGRRADARAELKGIYDWFTEGLETADLRAARALLTELGRPRSAGIRDAGRAP
jgi:DNA-binding winged helix-turn-helix (wHTH) protein/tetratricopeptide (TPR) repeat protein